MASWTAADQAELERLEALDRQMSEQEEGDPHAEAHVAKVAAPKDDETQSFSIMRGVILGPARDTIQAVSDFVDDAGDFLQKKVPLPGVEFTKEGINFLGSDETTKITSATRSLPELPQPKGTEHAGTAEKMTRSILSYLVPYTGWAKALGVMKAATMTRRIALGAAAGALTDITAQDPVEGNIANTIKDVFQIDDPTLDALTTEEDDDRLLARLKAAAVNLPIGVAAEGLFEAGAKAIKLYRGVRGDEEEARALIEAARGDYSVKRPKPDVDAEAGALEAPKPSDEAFDAGKHVGIDETPKTWEDVLDFLKRHGQGNLNVADDIAKNLAAIAHGDPENILSRLGIDPTKLDWSQFANPEGAANLHKAIMDVYEDIAGNLGRTGKTVGEAEIVAGARALASDADVLKALYGSTSKLPETLMAARMFVGSHAHKLLSDAEAALQALLKGDGGMEAWNAFLESFHRHAFFLGSVRGAGSEIARALRSLQMVARTDPATGKALAKDVEKATKLADGAGAKEAADEAKNAVLAIETDAERIQLLNTILEKGGDVGDLAQFVRQKTGSALKRVDGASKETLGNLFSQATAAFNVKSGLTFLGLRAMSRWLSAAARMGLAPFGAGNARAFRVASAEAWAYTDGLLSSVTGAVKSALGAIEKEAATELFVNADNLGLQGVAKNAAKWQAKGRGKKGVMDFERVDLADKPLRFAMNPADRRAIYEVIESYTLPGLMERALKWYVRATGSLINAAGTASRVGTVLFINAPDQFVGSIAAKAGAQAFAVRQAASEAAELGLEGKALSDFLKARVVSLGSDVDGWHDKGMEMGFREAAAAAGEHEAREILFQDPLEFASTRAMGQAHNKIAFAHWFVAFLHTPLRILERTAIDFTPIGLLKDRMRKAIIAGGPQRDQALAQMGLGVYTMALAYRMAEDRDVVGHDGGFVSTARLEREAYSLRIGGDVYEFKRDDPLGTLLGMAADVRAYIDNNNDGPEAEGKAQLMFEAGAWAITANMLSKTWLQSVSHLAELAGAWSEGQFNSGLHRWLNQATARRVVPGAGVQKGIADVFDPFEREATTYMENALKVSIGAPLLPQKRDFLGQPMRKNEGERFTGLTWQPAATDKLVLELEKLSFQAPPPTKEIDGVRLSPAQINRFNELKGTVVVSDKFGMTMDAALNELIRMPEYQELRKEARIEQIRSVMKEYTKLAKQTLLTEEPELAKRVLAMKVFDGGRKANLTDEQIDETTRQLGIELGLTE